MDEQWYAVIDSASGELLSEGTVLPDDLPEGLVALPVETPDLTVPRFWDAQERRFYTPDPPGPSADDIRIAGLLETARKPGATQAQKLDALLALLSSEQQP